VHANLPGLGAILADVRARGVGETLCLGDPVGYGPHPNEVVALLAVHASPRRINECLFADRPEHLLARIALEAEATLGMKLRALLFGHTHMPYVRDVRVGEDGRIVCFANVGSAGRPRDGDWRVCHALVYPGASGPGRFQVELVHVPWDRNRLLRDLAATSLITTYDGPQTSSGRAG
jgi:hypothetical protein